MAQSNKTKNFQRIEEFKENTQFNDKLGLDDRDNIIMSLIQKDPSVSQEEIASKIKLSQPAVGARLKRLRDKGILHTVNGVNFRVADLVLAKVDITTTDTIEVLKEFSDCPFFINALLMSGKRNLCLFFTATDLKRLEGIVNHHLRGNPKVKDIDMNIVISTSKDFVLPLSIDYENKHQLECKQHCRECV